MSHWLFQLSIILCLVHYIQSRIVANELFSDGLVLQTNSRDGVRSFIYGSASPYETIQIAGSIPGAPYMIHADANGDWKCELNPNGDFQSIYNLSIIGETNTIKINHIKYGEVLLCVGSENMAYPMNDIYNASFHIKSSVDYPNIYIAKIPKSNANEPQTLYHQPIQWQQANPMTLPSFSALCYLSAQRLLSMYSDHQYRNMGLIQVAVDDSTLNCWMSSVAQKQSSIQCADHENPTPSTDAHVCNDSSLFNGMVNPLVQLSVRAGVFDQGSNDVLSNYGCKWSVMINNYRDLYGSGDYPFAFVQASSVNTGIYSTDPKTASADVGNIRMRQSTNQPTPNGSIDTTAMALSYDLGNRSSYIQIHKAEIAERVALKLARIAPVLIYDHNQSLYDGPIFDHTVLDSDNQQIALHFSNLGHNNTATLQLTPTLGCSECCSANNTFQLSIDGEHWFNTTSYAVDRTNKIMTLQSSVSVNTIHFIRYAWSNFVECAVTRDGSAIPSTPFLIDINGISAPVLTDRHVTIKTSQAAMTPPMGFNHWNFAHCNIDERLALTVAEFMVSSGLRDAGYQYFNLDDCWQTDRDYVTQVIIPDSVRFPSGMQSIARHLSNMGMKFGIYTARKQYTCQGRYASYMHEAIDVETYCDWGVSYIKLDACHGEDYPNANQSWIKFRAAIDACYNRTGNDMVLSVESCGSVSGCGQWVGNIANLWRTGGDIQDNWNSMMNNADVTQSMWSIAGPGHWNDPDMLEIGNAGLSLNEEKVQFSLWAIMASPLLIATNLLKISNDSLAVLLNEEVIAINQDVLGRQGHKLYANKSGTEIWYRQIAEGNVAVCLLNRMASGDVDITVNFVDVGVQPTVTTVNVRDLWQHKDLGNSTTGKYTVTNVPYHACSMLKLSVN
eukprot:57738_1